jgi:hypothetical protein
MAKKVTASAAKGQPAADESQELLSEVKAFASQLGLAGGDHAFDDFAPQQSKQKLATPKRKHSEPPQDPAEIKDGNKSSSKSAGPEWKRSKADKLTEKPTDKTNTAGTAGSKGVTQEGAQVVPPISDAMAAAIKERTWNTGVGPRPGQALDFTGCHSHTPEQRSYPAMFAATPISHVLFIR